MHTCKSNFAWRGVPYFQHFHQCPTRLTPPEGMSHPVFYTWNNLVWSALVPVPCTQDHVRHMHSATRKGLSAVPVPLHGREGPMLQQSSTTQGQTPVTCKPTTQTPEHQQEGLPSLTLPFPQSPRKATPQDCSALLSLWGALDKMCQNLTKRALSCRRHQRLKAVYEMHPRPLGKKKKNPKERKKKEAFSCPNMNTCFYIIIHKTSVWKLIPIVQSFNTAEPGFTTLRNLFVTCKKKISKWQITRLYINLLIILTGKLKSSPESKNNVQHLK